MNPLVTVIVPVYNAENYVDRGLSSIEEQHTKITNVFVLMMALWIKAEK